jgi:integrase/recombinase XerD
MLAIPVNAFHEKLLTEFLHVRIARGFNRGKGDSAPILCREYLQFLENNQCEYVTSSHVFHYRKFCEYIKTRKKFRGPGQLGPVHVQHIRYAVHSFYEFLFESDYIESIPVTGSMYNLPSKNEKQILSKRQIEQMFSVARSHQEKAILALAYGCGLRRSEIERLQISDFQPSSSLISVRQGKYFKSRVIPVSIRMKTLLSDYLNDFRLRQETNTPLFLVGYDQQAVDGEAAYQTIRKLAKRAEIKDKSVGLHILRNSVAVHMLNRGADIEFVQRFLGHSLLDTTMLYATRRRKRISLKRRINGARKTA